MHVNILSLQRAAFLVIPVKSFNELAKEIDARLDEVVGGVQRWSGRVFIESVSSLPDYYGVKRWNCDIWLRDDCTVHTLTHELLHGRSAGLAEWAYSTYRAIEEATVGDGTGD